MEECIIYALVLRGVSRPHFEEFLLKIEHVKSTVLYFNTRLGEQHPRQDEEGGQEARAFQALKGRRE